MTSSLHRRPVHRDPAHHAFSNGDPRAPFLGRLVFPTGHGARSIIVECLRSDGGYLIHLPAFNEAGNYLTDTTVSLTPVQAESAHPAEVISGHSRFLADHEVDLATAETLERWSDRPARYFRITPHRPTSRSGAEGRRPRPRSRWSASAGADHPTHSGD